MRRTLLYIIFCLAFISCGLLCWAQIVIKDINDIDRIRDKAREAKAFVKKNDMNADWCMLLDFSYDLYTRRLIVYDLKSNEIIRRELVSHGNGGGSTPSKIWMRS